MKFVWSRWDAVTGKAFGDSYYNADDADDDWKPGDDPMEGLGDLKQYDGDAGDEAGDEDGTTANFDGGGDQEGAEDDGKWGRRDREEQEGEEEEEDWGEHGEGKEDEEGYGGVGAQKEQLLDELYKLDYEDIIGDIPCRWGVWVSSKCYYRLA